MGGRRVRVRVLSSRAEGRVRGEYGFSSLVKQNKKGKICFVIYIAGFFFKFFSVMKCLRSKKRLNSLITTTRAHGKISACEIFLDEVLIWRELSYLLL